MELSDETTIVKKPWSSLKVMAMQKDVEEQEWFKNLTQKDQQIVTRLVDA